MNTLEILGRDKLMELLKSCSNEEIDIFNRMYGSVETIPLAKMDWAIQQCERTLKNK